VPVDCEQVPSARSIPSRCPRPVLHE
jgi:hypothetical protein